MTAPDLPESWDDEPWPLDDPTSAPTLRPSNWSDTHDQAPQVADLADEAEEYALDNGISLERALAELQRCKLYEQEKRAFIAKGDIRVHFVETGEGEVVSADGTDLTEFLATPDWPVWDR